MGGVRQYVFATFTGITGLSPEGEQHLGTTTPGPRPLCRCRSSAHRTWCFVATADDTFGGMMIRVIHEDGAFRTEEMWTESV